MDLHLKKRFAKKVVLSDTTCVRSTQKNVANLTIGSVSAKKCVMNS